MRACRGQRVTWPATLRSARTLLCLIFSLCLLPAVADVASQDRERRFNAVKKVRKLLSKEQAPPALEVIQAGLVPILVRFLSCTEDPKIQFEAAWALTNISSTEHTASPRSQIGLAVVWPTPQTSGTL